MYEDWYSSSKTLRIVIHLLKERVRNAWDCVIVITGEQGVGKSSLGIALSHLLDSKFKWKEQVFWSEGSDYIINKVKEIDEHQVVMYDEAVHQFLSSEWNTKSSRDFVKEYVVNRSENKIHILCIPDFGRLTKYMREERVKFWFHITKRGSCKLMIRDDTLPVNTDRWNLSFFERAKKKSMARGKTISHGDIVKLYRKIPNSFLNGRTVHFRRMPEKIEEQYEDIKDERKRKSKVENIQDDVTWKKQNDRSANFVHALYKMGYTTKEISAISGDSDRNVLRFKRRPPTTEGIDNIINKRKRVKIIPN